MTTRTRNTLALALLGALIAASPALAQHGHYGGHGGGFGGFGIGGLGGLRGNRSHGNSHDYNNHGHHDRGYSNNHYQPSHGYSNNHYQPSHNNSHYAPQTTHAAPQAAAAPPPEVKPAANLPPAVTVPNKNMLKLVGRPLTAEELRRARDFFKTRLDELIRTAISRLPAIEYDQDKLVSLMTNQDMAAETQIRLIDAIRGEKLDIAQELWLANCTSIEPPFRRSRLRLRLADFCSRWEGGQFQPGDALLLERELLALGLAEVTCCGAPSLLEDIQHSLLVGQVINQAIPGHQSQVLPVPPGEVDIIYHPRLADGETIVLNQQSVMLGTGGIGDFHVQHGNVAQAQGYSLLGGPPVQPSSDRLIMTGILIENPSGTPVQFNIDNQPFTLQPGNGQLFTGESRKIAFNTGDKNKITNYQLPQGTFRFETPNRKWDLHRVKAFEATIDNRNNDAPFKYIAQGEHQEVAAHSVAAHTSPYPIIIRFDRGNGTAPKQVACTTKQASFAVGINPQDNLWDMHSTDVPASAGARPASSVAPATGGSRPAF